MLITTRGIVFHQTRYAESSLILKIFTERLGLQSFIAKGIHRKRSAAKAAFFQPLNLLNLVIDHREGRTLHYIREISVEYNYQTVHVDMNKRAIILFLAELLHHSIREETPNPELFNWLFHALRWFDISDNENLNFHLVFMIQLSRFLGFYPQQQPGTEAGFFDMQEGEFTAARPAHPDYLHGDVTGLLMLLRNTTFENSGEVQLTNPLRRKILDALLHYYRLHLPGFSDMKSVEILKSVLD